MSEYNVMGSLDAIERIVERFSLEVVDRFPVEYYGAADWHVLVSDENVEMVADACDASDVDFMVV